MSDDGWCYFLVRGLEPKLLKQLRKDADTEHRSLQDYMRMILCDHYSLDCPPSGKTTRIQHGSPTQRLRIQPTLFSEIKRDSAETGESMQVLVHAALTAHYAVA